MVGADNAHCSWPTITVIVGNLTSYLILGTKLLHRILGFQGPFFDEISHLPPDAFLDAVKILATAFFTVTPQSVTKLWSKFNRSTYELGGNMLAFTNDLRKTANQLKCDGAALQNPRQGPTNQESPAAQRQAAARHRRWSELEHRGSVMEQGAQLQGSRKSNCRGAPERLREEACCDLRAF